MPSLIHTQNIGIRLLLAAERLQVTGYRAVSITINIEFVCPHYNQKRKPHVVFYNEYWVCLSPLGSLRNLPIQSSAWHRVSKNSVRTFVASNILKSCANDFGSGRPGFSVMAFSMAFCNNSFFVNISWLSHTDKPSSFSSCSSLSNCFLKSPWEILFARFKMLDFTVFCQKFGLLFVCSLGLTGISSARLFLHCTFHALFQWWQCASFG